MDLQTCAFILTIGLLGLAMYMLGKYGIAEMNSSEQTNKESLL
jgi:hypothetical protein